MKTTTSKGYVNSTLKISTTAVNAWRQQYTQFLTLLLLLLFSPGLFAAPTLLSTTDKHASVELNADSLGAVFSVANNHRAVRSTLAIEPGSGFYYYEGHREVAPGNFGFGVATSDETLDNYGGFSNQSLGVNALGYIYHDRSSQIVGNDPTILANDTVGLAVDYRGINPIVYVIVESELFYSRTLSDITDPLFIFVYGHSTTAETQQSINAGDDLLNLPFTYDAVDILTTAGVSGPDDITLGWQRTPETTVRITADRLVAVVGDNVTLTSSAIDALGIDISPSTQWTNLTSFETGTGVTFIVSSVSQGNVSVQATVLDESGLPVVAGVTVDFQWNPLGDEDLDGLPNGYESDNDLDPLVNDAAADPDLDGFSNLAEYLAGTDPQAQASYPGAVVQTRLSDTDIGPGVSLSSDRLGAIFSVAGSHRGVRSDIAVNPGSGFYYYEGHREVPRGNYGFGVATSATSLESFGGRTDQSLGVNAAGYIYYSNAALVSNDAVIRASETYGIAVDYRGATPVVHVILAGNLFLTQELSSVSDPLHVLVYGQRATAGVQQTINTGSDLVNSPFSYDARSILMAASVSGAESLELSWGGVVPQTEITISGLDSADTNTTVSLTATAQSASGADISGSTLWLDQTTGATGSGTQFDVNGSVAGDHIVTATVLDEQGLNVIALRVITFSELDTDSDGLSDADELQIGTDISNPDTDEDGLDDGEEVNQYGTNPLTADSDSDGVGDSIEVLIGSDPLIADGDLDSDGDGFSNSQEVQMNTDPGSPYSYPGAPIGTRISDIDKHPSVSLSNGGLTATFNDTTPRSARSTISVAPGEGWFYFEGRRETGQGSYGIGVASASAPLDSGAGENSQSVGITTNGLVRYDSFSAEFFNQSSSNEYYGLGVDYSGSFPIVYPVVTGQDGYRQVLSPIELTDVFDEVFIVAFGETRNGGSSLTINTGDYPLLQSFQYPAHYELFTAGYSGAEFMGTGWGTHHTYSGIEVVEEMALVNFELGENSGAGITLSANGLSAAYGVDEKMGVRSNQGMIGEFRYYEGIRLQDEIVKLGSGEGLGFGYGLIPAYSRINPYPFDPEQPSMSVNALNGIWQNLNFVQSYNTDVYHYGFAVDYRASRPLVHVIIDNEVVRSLELTDVFTPLYPLNYGNTQGAGVFATASNFGATAFFYDPKDALERAGIDTTGFVSGWGQINNDSDADNLLDSIEIALGTAPDSSDSDNDGLRDGDEYHVHGTSPLSADSDSDTMPDAYELAVGQDPLVNDQSGDIDGDDISNIDEYLSGTGLTNQPPLLQASVENDVVDLGESLTFNAAASDLVDGDLTAVVQWSHSGGPGTGTGAQFTITPIAGTDTVTASVTDSGGLTTAVDIDVTVIDPSIDDADGDGISDQDEAILGTDPNLADTDGDTLNDGVELNVHGTNPLLADTDADGMSDDYEITHGFNALNPLDAQLDADNDGRTNLLESLIGLDPNVADPPALTDIVIDNDDVQASVIAGQFIEYSADEQFGFSATYALVGEEIDRYRFTPTIEISTDYEVFAWNSCFDNRSTTVKHIVHHANGIDTIEVNQSCLTGTHGEWFSLGIFSFDLGTNGYLEITDQGIVPSSTTYMGADAARFLLVDNNQAPEVLSDTTSVLILAGESVSVTATAFDAEDGDLTAQLNWSDGVSVSATGGSFDFVPSIGEYTVTASVSDSEGKSTVLSIPVSVVGDDNDGLSVAEELALGTDPANADTDNDGLLDGEEVNTYLTSPLNADSDFDGLPDQFEVSFGLNPIDSADAALDPDGDGLTNLQEYEGGTDPSVSENNSLDDIIIVNGGNGTSTEGTWRSFDGGDSYTGISVWATVGGEVDRYRFTPFLPSDGNYEVFAWNDCFNNRAADVRHVVSHAAGEDIIEVDQDCDTGSHGEWFSLGIYPFVSGSAGYLEISDDGLVSTDTTYLGADAARFLFSDTNQAPVLTTNLLDTTIVDGDQLSLFATAQDAEDGDLSALVVWTDGTGSTPFTGSSFVVQPAVGIHEFTVSVIDSEGAQSIMTGIVTVVQSLSDLDSDSDGLNDGDEVLLGTEVNNDDTDGDTLLDGAEVYVHLTDPNSIDSDLDQMNDAFEVEYFLNPNDPNDAFLDNDGDGLTNLEEHDAGSDPNAAAIVDIILINGGAGTSSTGTWSPFPGSESYSDSSLWATAGGDVDRYRFTPTIELSGNYEIFAWNSCYSNRATNVPHTISYGAVTDTVAVDQDCDTGSHGEWFLLGSYYLPAGTSNYVEISDDALSPAAATYLGADSVRFVRQ